MPSSSIPYKSKGRRMRSVYLPINRLPNPSPAMNADNTMAVAETVFPRMRVSIRTQTTSYIRPLMPETKKRPLSEVSTKGMPTPLDSVGAVGWAAITGGSPGVDLP